METSASATSGGPIRPDFDARNQATAASAAIAAARLAARIAPSPSSSSSARRRICAGVARCMIAQVGPT